MKNLIAFVALLSLTACSEFPWVYKIDIEQGNIIEQEQVDQLIPGLTKSQVQFLLGSPLNIDTFNQERWDYIYSIAHAGGKRRQERLSLVFADDTLQSFTGDFIPSSAVTDDTATPTVEQNDDGVDANKAATTMQQATDNTNQEVMASDDVVEITLENIED